METALKIWIGIFSMALAACSSPPPAPPAAPAAPPAAPLAPVLATPAAPASAPAAPLAVPGSFADNPIVYVVVTDRFENGNPANDGAYGRRRQSAPQDDVGTFHGGDLRGITARLKQGWFRALGVNAISISAPFEQIRGWVVGGQREFRHHGYHGRFPLDYTRLDAAFGQPGELQELVDTAHAQGIRVLFDVVMNHPGPLDLQTAHELGVRVLWPGHQDATLRNYASFIDSTHLAFGDWWGREWVRAALPGYTPGGTDPLTLQVAGLPDFRTESRQPVRLPRFLKTKPGTRAVDLPQTPVRGYLVTWLTDWVRQHGIDGFRADAIQHVEPEAWLELKTEATKALALWKANHPAKKIDDELFWLAGEPSEGQAGRQAWHDAGFDALASDDLLRRGAEFARPEAMFAAYAKLLGGRPGFTTLNRVSSDAAGLFDRSRLADAGSALLLAPGGVQIFYGDETARPAGHAPAGDPQQAHRSDMNWAGIHAPLLAHWRKLGSFRARHVALARGGHRMLSETPYAFSRIDAASDDRVVVALQASGPVVLPVADTFPDGQWLHDAYSGQRAVVANGQVALTAAGTVLLERAVPPLP
jgi:alpha-amylase